ncbi:MAG: hypothetical protein R6U44_12015 [Archaeoglobaceae archaeon]
MSCIFCTYFAGCGGMAEICEYFVLRDKTHSRSQSSENKFIELRGKTISEAASRFDMSISEFLEMLGKLERDGKIKLEII